MDHTITDETERQLETLCVAREEVGGGECMLSAGELGQLIQLIDDLTARLDVVLRDRMAVSPMLTDQELREHRAYLVIVQEHGLY